MKSRGITEHHRREIVRLLHENRVMGVLSKVFYDHKIFRYSSRMYDLRKRGYVFAKHGDSEGNSNYDRFWLIYDPEKKQQFDVPQGAKIVGKQKINVQVRDQKKPVRWIFNNETNSAMPVYA